MSGTNPPKKPTQNQKKTQPTLKGEKLMYRKNCLKF